MQQLWKRYRPRTLADIVGQPPVRYLQRIVQEPRAGCWCLEGRPGTGKTAAALAFAADLGCYDKETFPYDNPPDYNFGFNTGLFVELGSELTIDRARELFGQTLRLRYGSRSGMLVLVLEELEYVSPQAQTFLKTALETKLPSNVIVVATSNDVSKLMPALLQRFKLYCFANGPSFMEASWERLAWIWSQECPGQPLPLMSKTWGLSPAGFSLRSALSELEDFLELHAPEYVGGAA